MISDVWFPRDETDNFQQKHDVELIKEEKRAEVETEIRIQVDELMREELKNLKLVTGFLVNLFYVTEVKESMEQKHSILRRSTEIRERRARKRERKARKEKARVRRARRRRT